MELKLIQLVKDNAYLYDRRETSYRNTDAKEKKWREISGQLDTPVERVKQRWSSLRDRYHREKRKINNDTTGSGNELPKHWKYFHQMSFLENVPKKNLTSMFFKENSEEIPSKIEELNVSYVKENCEDIEADMMSEPQIPFVEEFLQNLEEEADNCNEEYLEDVSRRNIKLSIKPISSLNGNKNIKQKEDVDYLFCKMVAASLTSLSRVNNMKAKTEIFQVLTKYVEKEEKF